MRKPWQTAAAFGFSLAVLLAAMGWASWTVLRLDAEGVEARHAADFQETVRLALWRMDSSVASLVARENGRPYFSYVSFYPAERAYTRMFASIRRGEVLMPSRLLTEKSRHVLLHFQLDPDGQLSSPQVPTGNMRDLAESGYVDSEDVVRAEELLGALARRLDRDTLLGLLPQPTRAPQAPQLARSLTNPLATPDPDSARSQQALSEGEQQARLMNAAALSNDAILTDNLPALVGDVATGVAPAFWQDDDLLLARRVAVNDVEYVQGAWLDWTSLRGELAESIRDLLPEAELRPLRTLSAADDTHRLAALPIRLHPGPPPSVAATGLNPLRISLIIAWICVLLGAAAVAVLLRGAIALSERRAAFVSAVTHELRTPLTTFRMYTEMLCGGMVAEEDRRQRYLETLSAEADRLGHLVENVLSYARLERDHVGGPMELIAVDDLLDRLRDRLEGRAAEAGMTLEVDATPAPNRAVRVDRSAVERILFNLVDNATKYAASAGDRRIHLEVAGSRARVLLALRDHGPGLANDARRRLFRPFSKSAQQAAASAPGVGLGLALSRRLARRMGGDLRFDHEHRGGARFVLTLPSVSVGDAGLPPRAA